MQKGEQAAASSPVSHNLNWQWKIPGI